MSAPRTAKAPLNRADKPEQTAAGAMEAYQVTCVALMQTSPQSFPGNPDGTLGTDPEYLRLAYSHVSALKMLVLWQEGRPFGRFPLVLVDDEPLSCPLGELTLAKLPLRRLKGVDVAQVPPEEAAFDEVFR